MYNRSPLPCVNVIRSGNLTKHLTGQTFSDLPWLSSRSPKCSSRSPKWLQPKWLAERHLGSQQPALLPAREHMPLSSPDNQSPRTRQLTRQFPNVLNGHARPCARLNVTDQLPVRVHSSRSRQTRQSNCKRLLAFSPDMYTLLLGRARRETCA